MYQPPAGWTETFPGAAPDLPNITTTPGVAPDLGPWWMASRSVTGYRAVEAGELADIAGSGAFRTGPAGEMGKGFFTSETSASRFAEGMSERGMGGPYTVVTTEIPADVAARSAAYSPAMEGDALFVLEEDLDPTQSSFACAPSGSLDARRSSS